MPLDNLQIEAARARRHAASDHRESMSLRAAAIGLACCVALVLFTVAGVSLAKAWGWLP